MKEIVREALHNLREMIQIFHLLDDEELEMLLPYFVVEHYPPGATVFKEGDEGWFIGFVLSGELEVKKQTEFKEKQLVLAILKKGSFAGELSMLDGAKRTATITAIKESSLLVLSRDALNVFIERHPGPGIKILRGIIRTMAMRQRMTSERLLTFF
jgi:CRP-like cAMP-binding protein